MNRILPWSIACALLVSCSTGRDSSGEATSVDPVLPYVQPTKPDAEPSQPDSDTPPAKQDGPARRDIVFTATDTDLTPRPGRPHYPDCSATRQDSCLQVEKKPNPDPGPHPVPHPLCPSERRGCKPPVPPPCPPGCNVPPPPLCPSDRPECNVEPGLGSFGKPAALAVNRPAGLEFAVGMDQETIIRELGDTPPAGYRDVNVAECMRVTLDTPAAVEIVGPNTQTRQLPKGKPGDFWNWSIRAKQKGVHTVHAKVEVLRSENGKCTEIPLDAFTKEVMLDVTAAGAPPPPPPPRPMCLKNGRAVPCGSWWSWTLLGWLTLAILLAGLVIAIVAKGRRRRLGRGSD